MNQEYAYLSVLYILYCIFGIRASEFFDVEKLYNHATLLIESPFFKAQKMLSLAPSQLEGFWFYLLQPSSRSNQVGLLCGLILVAILVSVYLFTSLLFWLESRSQNHIKLPPIVPYMFPFIGSALSFGLNPAKCLSQSRSVFYLPR